MKKLVYLFLSLLAIACKNNPETTTEKIDNLLQEAYEDKNFIGNVLVVSQGKILYEKSFGNANQKAHIQNSDTTKFLIASISKPITAILILKLVDRGVLDLNDSMNKYFENIDSRIGKISIHQLLTHTSGITEIIGKERNKSITSLINTATLKFEPGSDFEYSNSGYVILKEIAEIATGKSYAEIMQTEIFDPARMTSSGIAGNSSLEDMAKGYANASQTVLVDLDFPLENVDGAGSVYSTTRDLYALDKALNSDSLLSPKMKAQMLKQHVPEKYSYGWFVRERGGIWDVYWQKGDLPGFTSFISRSIRRNQCIIILSNAEHAELSDIENDIARILKASN